MSHSNKHLSPLQNMKIYLVILTALGASAYTAPGLCVADPFGLSAGNCVVDGTIYNCDPSFPCTKNYSVSRIASLPTGSHLTRTALWSR